VIFNVLISAAENGHLEIVKLIVEDLSLNEHGIDTLPSLRESFRMAARKGHLDIIQYLESVVSRWYVGSIEVNLGTDLALEEAASNGHLEVVKFFVSLFGYDPVKNGFSFKIAVWYGQLEVVKYLLNLGGAEIDYNDKCFSLVFKHYEIMKLLQEKGI